MILQYMFENYTKRNSAAFSKNNSPAYKECINHLSKKSVTEIFYCEWCCPLSEQTQTEIQIDQQIIPALMRQKSFL